MTRAGKKVDRPTGFAGTSESVRIDGDRTIEEFLAVRPMCHASRGDSHQVNAKHPGLTLLPDRLDQQHREILACEEPLMTAEDNPSRVRKKIPSRLGALGPIQSLQSIILGTFSFVPG